MIGRICFLCLETLAAVAAVLAVVAGVGVWRLSQGPVTLDGLTPRLERALSDARPGATVSIGGTALAWRGWPETFALRLGDVRVRQEGAPLVHLPELDMQLSVAALVRGTLAPTSVTARGTRVTLVRGAEGFELGGDAGDSEEAGALLGRLLDDLMAVPAPDNRLSYLDAVTVTEATLRVRDERLDVTWRAPDAHIALRRTPTGLAGDLDTVAAVGEARLRLDGELAYTAGGDDVGVRARASEVNPAALADAIPAVETPGSLSAPLDVTVDTRLGLDGRIGDVAVDLEGGPGTLTWPARYDAPLPIRELALAARYDRDADRLHLRDLALTLGTAGTPGPRITGEATLTNALAGPATVKTEVAAEDVAMARLERYWPRDASANTRQWLTQNIPKGRVDTARVAAELHFPERFAGKPRVRALDGTLRFRGLAVHYMRPLPPVTGVSGKATLDRDRLDVTAEGGTLGPVEVTNGDIAITGLEGTDHEIAIDLDAAGPLRHALSVLNHPRLGLVEELGMRPEAVSGRMRGELHFAFPLLDDLRMAQLTARAEAELTDVAVRDFLLGKDATEGRLDLRVTTGRMELSGPVKLARVPLEMAWTERFAVDDGVVSRMRAQIPELTGDARRRLGVDTAPYLTGPVAGTVVARTHADGGRVLDASVTLDRAELAAPRLDWRKPADRPGRAAAKVRLPEGGPPVLDALSLTAGGEAVPRLEAVGAARFTPDGGLRRLSLDRLRLGKSELETVAIQQHGERWSVRVGGGRLDLRPWLGRPDTDPETAPADTEAAADGPALTLAVAPLERVTVAEGRYLADVAVSARRTAEGTWRAVRADARVPERFARGEHAGGQVLARYLPDGDGRQRLDVEAGNLGATLRALDVAERLRGGALTVEGRGRTPDRGSPLDGKLSIQDLTVKEVPALARLLTLASLQGLADMLGGKGVTFQEVTGEFTYSDGTLATQLVHAYGPSLGITTKGTLGVPDWTADLQGTVVPAARVNRLLERIPLLGRLITGGEGQGLIAVRYALSGPLGDPEISVNPLSALTPGFLRGVFGLFDRDAAPDADWPKAVPDTANGGR